MTVLHMVSVTCPICEEEIKARDPTGLGTGLKEHLMTTHRMENLACIQLEPIGGPAKEIVHYEVEKEVTVERTLGETPSRREVVRESPAEVERESVQRTGEDYKIRCPFCNVGVEGDDEDDLGNNLKEHWGDAHQIRPTIRAELGMTMTRERV